MTPDPLLQAIEHFRAGRYNESAEICVGILAGNADNPEINHLLGFIRFNQGKSAEGVALLKRAVSSPDATAEMYRRMSTVQRIRLGSGMHEIAVRVMEAGVR